MNATCYLCRSTQYRDVFVEDGVPLRRCLSCGHVYSSWDQDDHYDGYWENGVDEADLAFWDHAHRPVYEEFLRKFVPGAAGTLVDVGCGLGFFVGAVRRARPGWAVAGYELSKSAVDWAAEHSGLADVVHQGALEGAPIAPASVDIVTMWDVIEHIPQPQALLRCVTALLKPSGFLFLQTPNWPFQYARARITVAKDRGVVPGKHYLEAKDHVNQFSRDSLTRLAVSTGFAPPTFEILPPVMAFGGQPSRPGAMAKVGVYHASRVLAGVTRGRLLANPTLFAFLRKEPPGDHA